MSFLKLLCWRSFAAVILALAFAGTPAFAAKCTGTANCRACKNCSSCRLCAKQGGSCGVCEKKEKTAAAATDTHHAGCGEEKATPASPSVLRSIGFAAAVTSPAWLAIGGSYLIGRRQRT